MKTKYYVKQVPSSWTRKMILKMHYAKRMPSVSIAFGLFKKENDEMIGVCTFGGTANYCLNNIIDGYPTLELNRLCLEEGVNEKNILSFFVSSCLKLLDGPLILVSYADSAMSHCGYIYQATNWMYTGLSNCVPEFEKNGRTYHARTFTSKYGTAARDFVTGLGYNLVQTKPKHRYLYFIGSKSQIKDMKEKLKQKPGWEEQPYPKNENIRYDVQLQKKKGFFFQV